MPKNKNYGIYKYLDCSTAHVTQKDMEILPSASIVSYVYSEGAWVYCRQDEYSSKELRKNGLSQSFIELLKYAQSKGCDFLRLDCDGLIHKGLKTYKW